MGRNLYRIDPSLKVLKNVLTGNTPICFHEDKEGFLWTGTYETGLQQYDQSKKLVRQFNYDASDSFSIFNNNVKSIFQNQQDTLWLSTEDGIALFNKKNGHFSRLQYKTKFNAGPYNNYVNHFEEVIQDTNGLKWFATLGGLLLYNAVNDSVRQYLPDANDTGSISSTRITCIIKDRTDDIWAGAYVGGGLNRLNKQRNHFRHYLAGQNVTCLYEDAEGTIWTGTEKGLYKYRKDADNFSAFFDLQSEIGTSLINGITEDGLKNLWISTQSAIVKLDAARTQSFIYSHKLGIGANSLIGGGVYITAKGEILIGHNDGFYYFFPEELAVRNQPAGIIITDFYINNNRMFPRKGTVLAKPIEETSNIVLTYNQNNLTFHFTVIDYRAPEINKYYTMLEGYDNNWREATGDKSIFYLNVSPGHYVFRVKAFNSDGVKAEKVITIFVNPPWWKTWWAYSIYGLLVLIAIFIIHRFQHQRIMSQERQKAQVKELAQAKEIEKAYTELKSTQTQLIQSEKMASLGELTAGIAHEIQNPLNFVNNFSEVNTELIDELKAELTTGNVQLAIEIADDIKGNEEKINRHGKRADAIVKGMLQHSRNTTGVKEPTDINALADEYLRLAYHGIRAKEKSFNAILKTDYDESIGNINIIPQDIGRVILNLMTNAFYAVDEKKKAHHLSYGGTEYVPTVSVGTKKTNGKIKISVSDNGNGIPENILDKIFQPFFTTKPTGQGTGLGLSLAYDIVKAHGGEIKVKTKEGEGTEFIIYLP
jgi:signal transduction histidine kinase